MRQRLAIPRSARLAASVMALLALPANAAAQISSRVATVQLTVTMPPGARLAPAAGQLGAATSRSLGVVMVNAPYRLRLRSTAGPGTRVVDEGRPGAVRLDAVRQLLDDAEREGALASVWVELLILPTY